MHAMLRDGLSGMLLALSPQGRGVRGKGKLRPGLCQQKIQVRNFRPVDEVALELITGASAIHDPFNAVQKVENELAVVGVSLRGIHMRTDQLGHHIGVRIAGVDIGVGGVEGQRIAIVAEYVATGACLAAEEHRGRHRRNGWLVGGEPTRRNAERYVVLRRDVFQKYVGVRAVACCSEIRRLTGSSKQHSPFLPRTRKCPSVGCSSMQRLRL